MSITLPRGIDADALAVQFAADIRIAQSDMQTDIDQVVADRELLKSVQPRLNKPWSTACELHVPYVLQSIMAMLAHVSPALLAPDPIYHADPLLRNDENTVFANAYEKYQQEQCRTPMRFREIAENVIFAALRDGTAGALLTWDTKKEKKPRFERVADGSVLPDPVMEDVVTYDAPRIDYIPIEKFGSFPVANRDLQTSPGAYYQMGWTGDEILHNIAAPGDAFGFDKAAVDELRKKSGDSEALTTASSTVRGITNNAQYQTLFHSRPYELTHIYYRLANEDSKKPAQDWYIVLELDSMIVLEARPNPWFHQQRPIISVAPWRDVEGYRGNSVAGTGAGQVQLQQTTLVRLGIDGTAKGIAPTMLVAESMWRRAQGMLIEQEPGGSVPFPDDYFMNGRAGIQPFSNGGYQPTILMPMYELTERIGDRSTGMNEANRGGRMEGNPTATESQLVAEGSMKIIQFIIERLAYSFSQIGQMLFELNYQFQGNDGPQELWNIINPDVDMFDAMRTDMIITTSGVRDTANRTIKAQQAMNRLQLLMQGMPPQYSQMLIKPEGLYNLVYDAFQANGSPNPERYLNKAPEPPEAGGPAQLPDVASPQQPQQPPQPQAGGVQSMIPVSASAGMPQMGATPPGGSPYPPGFIEQIAQQLGIAPEELLAWAAEMGFPPPDQLIAMIQEALQAQQAQQPMMGVPV